MTPDPGPRDLTPEMLARALANDPVAWRAVIAWIERVLGRVAQRFFSAHPEARLTFDTCTVLGEAARYAFQCPDVDWTQDALRTLRCLLVQKLRWLILDAARKGRADQLRDRAVAVPERTEADDGLHLARAETRWNACCAKPPTARRRCCAARRCRRPCRTARATASTPSSTTAA